MEIEKDIIQDQKETIHRLQEECKEKTDIIMALEQENAELKEYEYFYLDKYIELKQALEKIRGICKSSKVSSCDECPICDDCEELCISDDNLQNIIIDKINEVIG